jgi:type II secretory pathway component PulF
MKVFDIRLKSLIGADQQVFVTASTESEARQQLGSDASRVKKVNELGDFNVKLSKSIEKLSGNTLKSPKMQAEFFQAMGDLLGSGVAEIETLRLILKITRSLNNQEILTNILYDIQKGYKLPEALERENKGCFDETVTRLLYAGQQSGKIAQVCKRLSSEIKKARKIVAQTVVALIVPAITMVILYGVVLIFSFSIVPQMEQVYVMVENAGMKMPTATHFLRISSEILETGWYYSLIPPLAVVLGYPLIKKFFASKLCYAILKKLPYIKVFFVKKTAYQFTSNLSMLLRAGIPFNEAVSMVRDSIADPYVKEGLSIALERLKSGDNPDVVFNAVSSVFGDDGFRIASAIEIGTNTGKLEDTLDGLREILEGEYEDGATLIIKFVNPLAVVIMGIVVGMIVYGIFAPSQMATDMIANQK